MGQTAPVRMEVRTVTDEARAVDASDEAGATDARATDARCDVNAAATAAGEAAATEATRFSRR